MRWQCVAEGALAVELVDLDDYAVGGEGQELALPVPVVDVFAYFAYVVAEPALVGHRQPPARRRVEGFPVGGEGYGFGGDVVERADEPPVGDLLRVDELERARSRVAGVREGRVLVVLALAVQGVEGLVGHQHFAAYLELLRVVAVELPRDVGNAQGVFGHVVAPYAVAAGERLDEASAAVGQAYRGAVEFQFAAVAEPGSAEGPLRPGGELLYLGDRVGVAEGEHRVAVPPLHEARAGERFGVAFQRGVEVGAYLVGGGVGAVELGVGGLQVLELVHQRVELEV